MMIVELTKIRISFFCALLMLVAIPVVFGDERDCLGTPHSGERAIVGLNASKCSICHGKTSTVSNEELPPDVRGRGNDGWIRGDELTTWLHDDLHYQAYAVLLEEQSQQMGKRLKIEPHRDRRCLACHSSMPVKQMKTDGDRVSEDTTRDSRFTIGVSCEACHGPAGSTEKGEKGWEDSHFVDKRWRSMTPKSKFEEFGYWDVHSTRAQTRICLSCHLGNVEQQKIITHEMYAAGHPPLPSFELSQFVHQMPRHWRRFDEKPKQLRDEVLKTIRPSQEAGEFVEVFDPQELVVTKMTMIAALVTLEESVRLTSDLISNQEYSSQWPELANYACFACHHELNQNSWRKTARLTTVAGRPSLHEWPFAISRAVAPALGKERAEFELKDEIRMLVAVLNSKPYGDPAKLGSAAETLAKSLEMQSRKLASISIDRERAKHFLDRIAEVASVENMDYDSARQFVWAYERTQAALEGTDRLDVKQELTLRTDVPKGSIPGNPIFNEFDESVVLYLQSNSYRTDGPKVELFPDGQKYVHKLRIVNMANTLDKIAKYRPESIQDLFKRQRQHQLTNAEVQ